jgi:hypothetical protein
MFVQINENIVSVSGNQNQMWFRKKEFCHEIFINCDGPSSCNILFPFLNTTTSFQLVRYCIIFINKMHISDHKCNFSFFKQKIKSQHTTIA